MLRTIVLFLFLLGAFPVAAQVMRTKRFTTDNGLPSDLANCLLQDRSGFLWIGTTNGLCRYDGYSFKVYRYAPDDPYSLAANVVESLYEDRNGTLWVGLGGGLSRFDRTTERFTSYVYRSNDSTSINGGSITSMYEDAKGRFWISAFNGGLQEMDRARGTFRCYFPQPEAPYREGVLMSSPLVPDPACADCFFIALAAGGNWQLFSFNGTEKTFTPCPTDSLPRMSYIWNILTDNDGLVWFITSSGVRLFDPKTRSFRGFEGLPKDFQKFQKCLLFSATKTPDGQIWVGTYQEGVFVLDKKRGITARYFHDPNDPNSLISNVVRTVLHDRSGALWVSNATSGLNRLVTEEQRFRNLRPDGRVGSQNVIHSITALCESASGHLWVGMENTGLLLYDPKTQQFQKAEQQFPALAPLKNTYVLSVCETRSGELWVGMNSQGVARIDPVRQTLQTFLHDPADSFSLSASYVNTLLEDRTGQMWLGTYQGLDRFDPKTGRFDHFYLLNPKDPAGALQNYIISLLEDRWGNIWIGGSHGLSVLNPERNDMRHFLRIGKTPGTLKNLYVNAIHQDRKGAIWAGTDNGLYRLVFPDPANPGAGTPEIQRYSELDGLPSRGVLALSEDNRGRIWINTLLGASVFRNPHHDDHTPPDFKNYLPADGIQSRAFMRSTCLKTRSGLLYFGGRNGFDVFHPDSIRDSRYQPPVVITAFEKFDTDHPDAGAITEMGVAARDAVELSYKNNIFTIEFAALDFREPENNRYAYRLLGFNDSWVQLGAQRRVTFTNLDPGNYTFEVRGTNSDGVWNETPAVLKIVITPPWWKTTWAYLVYALLLAGGVAGFVRARVRYLENRTRELEKAVLQSTAQILEQKETLEKQAGELQELDRLKSRFYANITHELRTPLTLMLGPLNSVLKNWKAEPAHRNLLKIAQENGRKLLNLISEILDLGKLDAGRMVVEAAPVAIQPLLARVVAQFDSHARYLGVNLSCRCDLPADRTILLDAKKFETVTNNLLSNALKFTPPGGSVEVELTEKPGVLLLSVQDTGRGIHSDDLPHVFDRYFQTRRPDMPVEGGTGIGLALSAELVRLCGGHIRVDSRVGEGAVFWVEWPNPTQNTVPNGERGLPAAPAGDSGIGNRNDVLQTEDSVLRDVAPLPLGGKEGGGVEPGVRILIAEDNPDLQAYLLHLLAPEYDVVLTANGEEALAALASGQESPDGFSLLISDIMMPRMDGFQLLEHLKNDDRSRHIPVVMLTARADIQDKLRALRSGVDDYLTKPFDEEELLVRVRNLVQRQQLRAALADENLDSKLNPESSGQNTPLPRISQADADWLAELENWTRVNLHDEFLTVSAMADHAALSERQLLRRVRELTGLSPQQYIGEMRLQKARECLELGTFRTVAEAAYAAGFGNAKAFSRAYRERFGRLPSSYF